MMAMYCQCAISDYTETACCRLAQSCLLEKVILLHWLMQYYFIGRCSTTSLADAVLLHLQSKGLYFAERVPLLSEECTFLLKDKKIKR